MHLNIVFVEMPKVHFKGEGVLKSKSCPFTEMKMISSFLHTETLLISTLYKVTVYINIEMYL